MGLLHPDTRCYFLSTLNHGLDQIWPSFFRSIDHCSLNPQAPRLIFTLWSIQSPSVVYRCSINHDMCGGLQWHSSLCPCLHVSLTLKLKQWGGNFWNMKSTKQFVPTSVLPMGTERGAQARSTYVERSKPLDSRLLKRSRFGRRKMDWKIRLSLVRMYVEIDYSILIVAQMIILVEFVWVQNHSVQCSTLLCSSSDEAPKDIWKYR